MPRQEMKGAPKFVVAYDDVGGRAAWALQTKTVNLIGRQFGAPACALSSRWFTFLYPPPPPPPFLLSMKPSQEQKQVPWQSMA